MYNVNTGMTQSKPELYFNRANELTQGLTSKARYT
jgi:hypothetical protein